MQTQYTVKPKSVTTAINLLWATLALSQVATLLNYSALVQVDSAAQGIDVMAFLALPMLFGLGLMIFLIFKISAGKNWARIVTAISYVFGIIFAMSTLTVMFSATPVVGVISMVCWALQGFALYLLFTNPGSAWFSKVVPDGVGNQLQQARTVQPQPTKFCSGCGIASEVGIAFCSNCGRSQAA